MKKAKFMLLTSLLLFSRGCDFYSTSLWFFSRPTDETNPLAKFIGFKWTGLVTLNIVIVGLIIWGYYYYTFRYKTKAFTTKPLSLKDFVSELYFHKRRRFWQILYKLPKNKKALAAHLGYVLINTVIVASFLASCHNLCQSYDVSFYNEFRETVKRPWYVIYVATLLMAIYFTIRQWKKEYVLIRNLPT